MLFKKCEVLDNIIFYLNMKKYIVEFKVFRLWNMQALVLESDHHLNDSEFMTIYFSV